MGWRETAALPAKGSWRTTAAKPPAAESIADLRAKDDSAPLIDPLEGEAAPEPTFVDKAVELAKPYLDPKSQTGAAARGLAQGGSLGFGDELAGALDTAGQRLGLAGSGHEQLDAYPDIAGKDGKVVADPEPRTPPTDEELYRTLRDKYRADNATSKAAFPKTYVAGEVLGGLSVPVPGGAAARGASIAAKFKAAAPGALALGGALGLGKSEAELTDSHVDPAGAAKDVVVGAGAGALGALGGSAAGRGFEKLGDFFGKKAGDAGAKAIGYRAGISNQAEQLGKTAEEMTDIGNRAREAGLIPLGGSKEAVFHRAAEKLNRDGERIGQIYDELGASGVPADLNGIAQDASLNVGAKYARDPVTGKVVQDALGRPVRLQHLPAPDQVRNMGLANKHLNDFVEAGEQSPGSEGWRLAQEMKTRAQATVNPKPEAPLSHELHEDAVQGTTRAIENRAGTILGPGKQAELIAANKGYGLAKDVSNFSRQAATREQQLKKPSMWSRGAIIAGGSAAGGVSVATSSPELGAVAGAIGLASPHLERLVSDRGAAVATHALGALQQLLIAGGDELPSVLGRGGALVAAQATPDARLEAHRAQMESDPEYAANVQTFLDHEADHAGQAGARAQPREGKPQGRPAVSQPRRGQPIDPGALNTLRARHGVDVTPMPPRDLKRTRDTGVDVQALPPTSMVSVHAPGSEEEQRALELERRMRLARFFGGSSDEDLDELQPQR